MKEKDTRFLLIDKQLEEAGWLNDSTGRANVIEEYNFIANTNGTQNKSLQADYLLEYDGRKIAVVEAKRDNLDVSEGNMQSELYASKLHLPFGFAMNGKEIYELAFSTENPSLVISQGKIIKFPSPQELLTRLSSADNEWMGKFTGIPLKIVEGKTPRYYQENAINRVMRAIANEKNRILLTLATGTGKTYITSQIVWKLFESRWTLQKDRARRPKILFLADRNFLADQARLEFRNLFNEGALVRIKPEDFSDQENPPINGDIFFTIFQTLMSGDKPNYLEYPQDFFDIVIIDECHRGGANNESSWRDILNYFSVAIHLGLTATPKVNNNVDTYSYFGEPVYTYSVKEGIQENYLSPFNFKVITGAMETYDYDEEDDVTDGVVDVDRTYVEEDFNWNIEIRERERLRVKEMMRHMNLYEKTLVFCATQKHAALVRDIINEETGPRKADYCVRVTSNDREIGEEYLKRFQDNDTEIPTILTTSRKLTTGVDAKNIRYIVLLRPIMDKIEFKQIIGRGTRIFEGKEYFTVIDFVGAYKWLDKSWDGDTNIEKTKIGSSMSEKTGMPSTQSTATISDMVKISIGPKRLSELEKLIEAETLILLNGKLHTVKEYIKAIIPEINSESELRKTWEDMECRKNISEKLKKVWEVLDASECDLFDIIRYALFQKKLITREQRVSQFDSHVYVGLDDEKRNFIDKVLASYKNAGPDEFDKLGDLLDLHYGGPVQAMDKLNASKETITRLFEQTRINLYKA